VSYSYLGLSTVVIENYPQPGVELTYVKQSGESNGDAGDQYAGLDRFGRVVDQRWIVTSKEPIPRPPAVSQDREQWQAGERHRCRPFSRSAQWPVELQVGPTDSQWRLHNAECPGVFKA
jgi:hypothetical protein